MYLSGGLVLLFSGKNTVMSKLFLTFVRRKQCPGLTLAPLGGAGGKSGQHRASHFRK